MAIVLAANFVRLNLLINSRTYLDTGGKQYKDAKSANWMGLAEIFRVSFTDERARIAYMWCVRVLSLIYVTIYDPGLDATHTMFHPHYRDDLS